MAEEQLVSFEVNAQTPSVRFLASLSDGRTAIEDARPGEPHAWHRLKAFLKANAELSITCLRLQGPGDVDIAMPASQKGYIFGYNAGIVFGVGQIDKVGVGYYDGTTCVVHWHNRAGLEEVGVEQQTVEQCGFKLITNP